MAECVLVHLCELERITCRTLILQFEVPVTFAQILYDLWQVIYKTAAAQLEIGLLAIPSAQPHGWQVPGIGHFVLELCDKATPSVQIQAFDLAVDFVFDNDFTQHYYPI
jgi:hypothetical protein